MDLKNKIFKEFLKLNNISSITLFSEKITKYTLKGKQMTKEEVMATMEFTGFKDGYQHRPHRFKNVSGTPDIQSGNEKLPLEGMIDSLNEIILEKMPDAYELTESILRNVGDNSGNKYDEQYRLGSTLN